MDTFLLARAKVRRHISVFFHRPAFAPATFCPKNPPVYEFCAPFGADILNRLSDKHMRYIRCRGKKNYAILIVRAREVMIRGNKLAWFRCSFFVTTP